MAIWKTVVWKIVKERADRQGIKELTDYANKVQELIESPTIELIEYIKNNLSVLNVVKDNEKLYTELYISINIAIDRAIRETTPAEDRKSKWEDFKDSIKNVKCIDLHNLINLIEKLLKTNEITQEKYDDLTLKADSVKKQLQEIDPYLAYRGSREIDRNLKIINNRVKRNESKDFGSLLKLLREKNNMTLNDLALLTDISSSYIHRLESGERRVPSAEKLSKIAYALEVEPKIFLDFDKKTKNKTKIKGVPELLAMSNYTINGIKANKSQKELLIDVVSEILVADWNEDSKEKDIEKIVAKIDEFKNSLK